MAHCRPGSRRRHARLRAASSPTLIGGPPRTALKNACDLVPSFSEGKKHCPPPSQEMYTHPLSGLNSPSWRRHSRGTPDRPPHSCPRSARSNHARLVSPSSMRISLPSITSNGLAVGRRPKRIGEHSARGRDRGPERPPPRQILLRIALPSRDCFGNSTRVAPTAASAAPTTLPSIALGFAIGLGFGAAGNRYAGPGI